MVTPAFQPIRLVDVELSRPLDTIAPYDEFRAKYYRRVQLFVRLCGYPIGSVDVIPDETWSREGCARLIWQTLHAPIKEFLRKNALEPIGELTAEGLSLPKDFPMLRERRELLAAAPPVCAIVCTKNRASSLARCLDHLLQVQYPDLEILVVDNAPGTDHPQSVHQYCARDPRVRYLRENRQGLSRARNCGLENTRAEIVAYIDDDEVADPNWLAELVKGFRASDNVACVTGAILPAEIETLPQYWFEQYGGHGKARAFDQVIFDPKSDKPQSALFPNPPFGAGGNMAFDAAVLRRIGGFDPALGAGTPSMSGEDTAAFFHVLRKGYKLVFSPAALVRHFHYRDYANLRQQFYGYGVGLTAFYTHCLLKDPRCAVELIRQVPKGVAMFTDPKLGDRIESGAFPQELVDVKLRGLLRGPFAYMRSLWAARHIR